MLAKIETVALVGTEARLIQVEVDVAHGGLPKFSIVGLPAKSIREAAQRTECALSSLEGLSWPKRKIVANLAPAALRKDGTHFDLPIALGVLAASGQVDGDAFEDWVAIGELALDGSLRPVPGALAAAITCSETNRRGLICPIGNASEAALIEGIEIVPVGTIADCIAWAKRTWEPPSVERYARVVPTPVEDLREVRGQHQAKAALEIAAAGGHNLLLIGSPGSGKTMLARRLSGILPRMSLEESMEVTRVHSVAGLLLECSGLITERPFRVPHHNVSVPGLVGGGTGLARPGEVSLAHRGVLFLDELGLYRGGVLDALRAPMEDGVVHIARAAGSIHYPCRFSLIAAMNPCPCGFRDDPVRACRCTGHQLDIYDSRLSGPLLDRFDMQIAMQRLGRRDLLAEPEGDASPIVRDRVEHARNTQCARYGSASATNASVPRSLLDTHLLLTPAARAELELSIDRLQLSGRGVNRVVRVARTVADLQGSETVDDTHIGYAVMFRSIQGDREAPTCA